MSTPCIRAPRAIALLLLVPVWGSGCTEARPGEYTLTGVVTYGDAPPLEGQVTLLGPHNAISVASLGADGSFRVVNPPTGRVRVAVTNYPVGSGPTPRSDSSPPPGRATCSAPPRPATRFPARYADPSTSDLVVDIAPGQERIDLHIPRRPDDPPVVRAADIDPVGIEVGQTAPEIAGDDLDGEPFKLSDHRGKVVAVMFWGHWCKLCRDRYPQERALVERMRGRPFVLLGVNTDTDLDAVRRENAKQGTTWRTWWDGPIAGPVAATWQVQGLPYVVLIDHTGVVRHRAADADRLDRAADDLVAAAEAAPAR